MSGDVHSVKFLLAELFAIGSQQPRRPVSVSEILIPEPNSALGFDLKCDPIRKGMDAARKGPSLASSADALR
jgi:hypothetical protein